ncbi:MAG TPA: hypothetical protein VIC05_06330 [Solirubrobacteraceae bacterium]
MVIDFGLLSCIMQDGLGGARSVDGLAPIQLAMGARCPGWDRRRQVVFQVVVDLAGDESFEEGRSSSTRRHWARQTPALLLLGASERFSSEAPRRRSGRAANTSIDRPLTPACAERCGSARLAARQT